MQPTSDIGVTVLGMMPIQHPHEYVGIRQNELGGGLNNILMNLAQLLHESCYQRPNSTLVLPPITSGAVRCMFCILPAAYTDITAGVLHSPRSIREFAFSLHNALQPLCCIVLSFPCTQYLHAQLSGAA